MARTCLFKFGASERRLEQFCGVVKPRKQKAELPFNASEQEKPCIAQIFCYEYGYLVANERCKWRELVYSSSRIYVRTA